MDYQGKLYGKVGRKYFETGKTANDFDTLEAENKQLKYELLDLKNNVEKLEDIAKWMKAKKFDRRAIKEVAPIIENYINVNALTQ